MYDMGIGCDSHFKEEFMRGYAKQKDGVTK